MMNATEIIRALGGPSAVMAATGAGRSAVSNWPREGIPSKYWPVLSRLTPTVTLEMLEHHKSSGGERASMPRDGESGPIKNAMAAA